MLLTELQAACRWGGQTLPLPPGSGSQKESNQLSVAEGLSLKEYCPSVFPAPASLLSSENGLSPLHRVGQSHEQQSTKSLYVLP